MATFIEKKDWFKDRGYLHLTNRITVSEKLAVTRYVSNPSKVRKHRFMPFILRRSKNRRFKYSDDLERRSHKAVDDKGQIISNAKERPIMYATHIDSHIYSFYAHEKIQPHYESVLMKNPNLNESVTAYRRIETKDGLRFKYNVDFANEVFQEIKNREQCGVLTFDIKNFFPSLNHALLKRSWSRMLGTKTLPRDHYALFKSVTNYSYFYYDDLRKIHKGHLDEKKIAGLKNKGKLQFFENYQEFEESGIQVYKNQLKKDGVVAGIPQGLPISALLANIYMFSFDEGIVQKLVESRDCFYRRYSDDLVVICRTEDLQEVEKIVLEEIRKIKLIISPSKTEKFVFKQSSGRLECFKISKEKLFPNSHMQYLGFDFYGHKTLIKSANIARFYREMKESIAMRVKRIEAVQKKNLTEEAIIYKRKIYRLFSFRGVKTRHLPGRRFFYVNGKLMQQNIDRKYRGNFLKYAYRASDILEAPEIRRQVRRHMIILKNYMNSVDLDNPSKTRRDK